MTSWRARPRTVRGRVGVGGDLVRLYLDARGSGIIITPDETFT